MHILVLWSKNLKTLQHIDIDIHRFKKIKNVTSSTTVANLKQLLLNCIHCIRWPGEHCFSSRQVKNKITSKVIFKNLHFSLIVLVAGLGIRSSVFWANRLIFFLPKNEQIMSEWAIHLNKRAICSFAYFRWPTWAIRSWSLIFGEQPERISHGCSFLMSDLRDSLTSLNFGERPERFAHIAH